MGAGRSEVDVEHDDAYHHNDGDQDHAEKQEPEDTHSAWNWGLRAEAWARLGTGRAIYTHLPTKGMAMDVAGSLLEISKRKTDWARSTEMATEVFSPPGETDLAGSSYLEFTRFPPPSGPCHKCSQCHDTHHRVWHPVLSFKSDSTPY